MHLNYLKLSPYVLNAIRVPLVPELVLSRLVSHHLPMVGNGVVFSGHGCEGEVSEGEVSKGALGTTSDALQGAMVSLSRQ